MHRKISVILFALLIFGIPIASVFSPYKTVSAEENRKLASFPEVSFNSIISKDFMNGFSNFVSDHIVARDAWIVAKEKIASLAGRRDNNGIYLCGDRLIQKIEEPKNGIYKRNALSVDDFAKASGKPTYLMLVPTAAEIQKDKLPAFAPSLDQKKFIKSVSSMLDNAKTIDVTSSLEAHKNEYIYYRTDHHWTALGAFYAYSEASKALGFTPLSIDEFNKTDVTDSFEGTLYSKSGSRDIKPDTITVFEPKGGFNLNKLTVDDGEEKNIYNSILFKENLSGKNKYEVFFDGNKPVEDIETTAKGEKLLVIKDSYAHAFVPYLMNHFSEITMLDLRYLNDSVENSVDLKKYDKILFLYNVDDFATDRTIATIS